MRDPLGWSFRLFPIFGIPVRLHVLMPVILGGFILREALRKEAISGTWIDAALVMGLLFFTVLLHELGHCLVGFLAGGESREIILWPLGGLAYVDVPHSPAAHFFTALGGPLVNVLLCAGSALLLAFAFDSSLAPPFDPFWSPYRLNREGALLLGTWGGSAVQVVPTPAILLLAYLFFVSWITLLLNMLLVGFPLDAGRMLQAVLWNWFGYRQATLYAVFTGFGVMFCVFLAAFVFDAVLCIFLGFFIYTACRDQWRMLVEGGNEDSLFGYDFSQGYTSLEKDAIQAPRERRRQNVFQRWLARRKQERLQRDLERQEADERRLDQLLQKIAEHGKNSLTDEEHRFMKRVAERYKNRP